MTVVNKPRIKFVKCLYEDQQPFSAKLNYHIFNVDIAQLSFEELLSKACYHIYINQWDC